MCILCNYIDAAFIFTSTIRDKHCNTCIDAQNKTKSLKFTNCIGITGSGLEPIRESTVLERIDLSLVGDHESPAIDPEPPISAETVTPILENILNTENNSLIHVQLPKKWRETESDIMSDFMENMDTVLNNRRIQCSKGCGICEGDDLYPLVEKHEQHPEYGINAITCYQCMKHYCSNCSRNCLIDMCQCCEKVYCEDCNKVDWCDECNVNNNRTTSCRACDALQVCDECGIGYCPDCHISYKTCQYCEKECCWQCSYDRMEVCQGEGCNRANCWDSDGCNASDAKRKRNYVRSYTLSNEEYAYCSKCAPCYIIMVIIADHLVMQHVRMLWRCIQRAVEYLTAHAPFKRKRQ